MTKASKPPAPANGPADPTQRKDWMNALLSPASSSAALSASFLKGTFGELDFHELRTAHLDRAAKVKAGDMTGVEITLVSQATALNAIFTELARRAALNMGDHLSATEIYMRLALKAQNQCRATLETLAAIKNPPTVFARQANFAAGPQQVNNGVLAHAGKIGNQPNELLEAKYEGERLDLGTPGEAGGSNRPMEAVGAIHGAAHG